MKIMPPLGALSGHFWTLAPAAAAAIRSPPLRRSTPWHTVIKEPNGGSLIRITGRLHVAAPPASDELVVLLHGIGGSCESDYIRRAASALLRAGVSCLRLNARGADRSGSGLSHAGFTADLAYALESPEVRRFNRLYVIGFSLGGHIALRYATEAPDPRLRAVAAVCAPLDLDRAAHAIDAPKRAPYRRYVLGQLREIYEAVVALRGGPISVTRSRQIRTLREWDNLVVAPRFGFCSAEDYYARVSVAQRLDLLQRPALVVAARHDPMVPFDTIQEALARPAPRLTARVCAGGGHPALPPWLDLGFGEKRGLEAQTLAWLRQQGSEERQADRATG